MISETFENDPFDSQNYVGAVSQVGHSSVKLSLPNQENGSGGGQQGEVGGFVVIECGEYGIFGRIVDLTIPKLKANGVASSEASDEERFRVGTIQLLSTIKVDNGEILPGIKQKPSIGDLAYAADSSLVQLVVESRNKTEDGDKALTLSFARLAGSESTEISFTPEMLFGRHCAVLGTTGGGKSWSVARLIEETSKHKSKVILFDATGEYETLDGRVLHVYLGSDPEPRKDSYEVVLPYSQLTENDLFCDFSSAW